MKVEQPPIGPAQGADQAVALLRTVLVCDLTDSTALVERLGDQAAAKLIRRHDVIARAAMHRHAGREFGKTDGFLVLFDRPIAAVAFALEYQRELRVLAQETGQPLSARVGIHVGDVILWDNAPPDVAHGAMAIDVEGLAKPVAARLMAMAHPGQILLTGVAYALARRGEGELGALAGTARWMSHGRFRIKGVPESIEVYEVGEAGKAPLRPPLGSLKAHHVKPWWRRRSAVAAAAMVLAVAASMYLYLRQEPMGWRGFAIRPDAASAAATVRSIVVLPLENLSGDPSQEYFADGMTEALINDLARIQALRVISRTSAMLYKGAKKPLSNIARELGVDAVLEGSVMRAGDRVRISADLVHASSGRHLWVQTYERNLKDVLALQSDVAQAIATSIRVQLTPQEKARFGTVRAVDPAAEEAYLRGRYEWNKRTDDSLRQALLYFQQAATIDPRFAKAYAGQADVYNMLPSSVKVIDSQSSPLVMYPLAKTTALKALAIDSTLAEAHASLGYATWFSDRDSAAAEAAFTRAIELNPGYATAHQWYADYLLAVNRVDDSLREIETAKMLDPLSNPVRVIRAAILYSARRYDEVIAQANEAIRADPVNAAAFYYLAVAYEQKGLLAEAENTIRRAIEFAPRDPFYMQELGRVAARKGDKAGAERIIRDLAAPGHQAGTTSGAIGLIYAALADNDRAFFFLAKAEQEHWPELLWAKTLPELDPLRSDPRFADLLRSLKLGR